MEGRKEGTEWGISPEGRGKMGKTDVAKRAGEEGRGWGDEVGRDCNYVFVSALFFFFFSPPIFFFFFSSRARRRVVQKRCVIVSLLSSAPPPAFFRGSFFPVFFFLALFSDSTAGSMSVTVTGGGIWAPTLFRGWEVGGSENLFGRSVWPVLHPSFPPFLSTREMIVRILCWFF